MSASSSRPLLPDFLPSLNTLLATLALPFTIDHPTDLTPSLLLAVFESLISARLPIPSSVRQSRTRDAKTRAMLVLLGVLECDVLRGGTSTDPEHSIADDSVLGGAGGVSVDGWIDEIGLGEVDPERLADGGWDETIFVGELLCWLARRKGILPRTKSAHRSSHPRSLYSTHHSLGTEEGEGEGDTADFSTSLLLRPSPPPKLRSPRPPSPSSTIDPEEADDSVLSHITDVPRHPLVHSPEPSLSVSATTGTDLSIRARSVSSRTSVSNMPDYDFEEISHDYDPRRMMEEADEQDDRPPTFRPRCIHDLDDPSYIRALAGPSTSFDPSVVSHDRLSDDGEEPFRDDTARADEQDYHDPSAPPTPTPRRVRLTGWIEPVDAAAELSHFAASRAHSRSRAFNTSGGSGTRPQSHTSTGEFHESTSRLAALSLRPGSSKLRTPRRTSPSPSPSPPPSPPPPSSSKHPPARALPSPSPSPPPSPAHSDTPFDVSFSTLNNTSTPAKPRPSQGSVATRIDTGTRPGRAHRSPSYTPSPPSFTTLGSIRGGSALPSPVATTTTRMGASLTPTPAAGRKNPKRTSPSPPRIRTRAGATKSPPPGSTVTTTTLLTERARLLTELAALKRARAASGGRIGATGTEAETLGGRRVGVGV